MVISTKECPFMDEHTIWVASNMTLLWSSQISNSDKDVTPILSPRVLNYLLKAENAVHCFHGFMLAIWMLILHDIVNLIISF